MTLHQPQHHTTSHDVAQTFRSMKKARDFSQTMDGLAQVVFRFAERVDGLLSRGAVVVDLGCGAGQDAQVSRREGHRVVRIDLTTALLRVAREAIPSFPLVRADIRELLFRAGSLDGIWAAVSLIHFPKQKRLAS